MTSTLAESLSAYLLTDPEQALHERLSDREFQVMCMVAAGQTTRDIAANLGLSPKSVSTYKSRALSKMELNTATEWIRYAVENGLV